MRNVTFFRVLLSELALPAADVPLHFDDVAGARLDAVAVEDLFGEARPRQAFGAALAVERLHGTQRAVLVRVVGAPAAGRPPVLLPQNELDVQRRHAPGPLQRLLSRQGQRHEISVVRRRIAVMARLRLTKTFCPHNPTVRPGPIAQ